MSERKEVPEDKGEAETDSEFSAGDVLRFISLPVEIDSEQTEASLQDEELVLVLPASASSPVLTGAA